MAGSPKIDILNRRYTKSKVDRPVKTVMITNQLSIYFDGKNYLLPLIIVKLFQYINCHNDEYQKKRMEMV